MGAPASEANASKSTVFASMQTSIVVLRASVLTVRTGSAVRASVAPGQRNHSL